MNKSTLIALTAATAIGFGSAGTVIAARAAEAPPPPPRATHSGPGMMHHDGWMHRPGMMHHGAWMHHRHPGMHPLFAPGTFALIYHPADRQLTDADVQRIAEGMLAWNGNHSWKVIDVKTVDQKEIGFSFATANGTVIASFQIDRHSGWVKRIG